MNRSIMDVVATAKSTVPAISAEEAGKLHGREDVLFVDVRDSRKWRRAERSPVPLMSRAEC